MSGVTSNEGFVFTPVLTPEIFSPLPDIDLVKKQLKTTLSRAFGLIEDVDKLVGEALGKNSEKKEPDVIRKKVTDILGDYFLVAPTYLAAQLLSGSHYINVF